MRGLRKMMGLSVKEAASANGESASAWYKWETGKRVPPLAKAQKLAAFFDVTVSELFFENELDETSKVS